MCVWLEFKNYPASMSRSAQCCDLQILGPFSQRALSHRASWRCSLDSWSWLHHKKAMPSSYNKAPDRRSGSRRDALARAGSVCRGPPCCFCVLDIEHGASARRAWGVVSEVVENFSSSGGNVWRLRMQAARRGNQTLHKRGRNGIFE